MKTQSFYKSLTGDQKYLLFCCYFIFAVNGLYAMILGPMLPLISNEYGLNNTISGGLISAHQTGNLIAGFLAGILPIYLGRKKSILFLCTFVVVGFSTMIITGNPVLLLIAFLFTGLSRGSISNFNNTVVNEVSGSSSSALSLLHSIFAVGALLGPFLIIASTQYNQDAGWKISAGIIILLALFSMFLFSRIKLDDRAHKTEKVISYGFLKSSGFWIGAGIFFFYLCTESAVTGWLVKYFVDSALMSTAYAQMLNSLLWVVILAGRLLTALIGDRISKHKFLLMTAVGTIFFYLMLIASKELLPVTIAIMGLGFSMAGIYPTTVATVGSTIKKYPLSMGVLLMIGGVGAIVMPLITGAVADHYGILAGMSAIVAAVGLMVICVILNLIHNRSKNQSYNIHMNESE